jgi:hypothetical protein
MTLGSVQWQELVKEGAHKKYYGRMVQVVVGVVGFDNTSISWK